MLIRPKVVPTKRLKAEKAHIPSFPPGQKLPILLKLRMDSSIYAMFRIQNLELSPLSGFHSVGYRDKRGY